MKVCRRQINILAIPTAVVVGALFCLQSVLWEPTVYAGSPQDAQKAGKEAVKATEINRQKAVKDTKSTGNKAVKGTERAGKQVPKDANNTIDDSGRGEPDTGSNDEDESESAESGYGDEEFQGTMDEGELAGYADEEAGYYEEGSSEESGPPVDLDELKGQIPGFTPFEQEESGSSEGSTVQGDRPWYEKLGMPGGGRPPSSQDDEE